MVAARRVAGKAAVNVVAFAAATATASVPAPARSPPSPATRSASRVRSSTCIGIHVGAPRVEYEKIASDCLATSSEAVRIAVEKGRKRQQARFGSCKLAAKPKKCPKVFWQWWYYCAVNVIRLSPASDRTFILATTSIHTSMPIRPQGARGP